MKLRFIVLLIAGAVVLGGCFPKSPHVFYACARNTDAKVAPDTITVGDATTAPPTCPTGTGAVQWNQSGTQGTPGVSGYEIVHTEYQISTSAGGLVALCPAGKVVLGRGFARDGTNPLGVVESSPVFPEPGGQTGWTLQVNNSVGESITVRVLAMCANAS